MMRWCMCDVPGRQVAPSAGAEDYSDARYPVYPTRAAVKTIQINTSLSITSRDISQSRPESIKDNQSSSAYRGPVLFPKSPDFSKTRVPPRVRDTHKLERSHGVASKTRRKKRHGHRGSSSCFTSSSSLNSASFERRKYERLKNHKAPEPSLTSSEQFRRRRLRIHRHHHKGGDPNPPSGRDSSSHHRGHHSLRRKLHAKNRHAKRETESGENRKSTQNKPWRHANPRAVHAEQPQSTRVQTREASLSPMVASRSSSTILSLEERKQPNPRLSMRHSSDKVGEAGFDRKVSNRPSIREEAEPTSRRSSVRSNTHAVSRTSSLRSDGKYDSVRHVSPRKTTEVPLNASPTSLRRNRTRHVDSTSSANSAAMAQEIKRSVINKDVAHFLVQFVMSGRFTTPLTKQMSADHREAFFSRASAMLPKFVHKSTSGLEAEILQPNGDSVHKVGVKIHFAADMETVLIESQRSSITFGSSTISGCYSWHEALVQPKLIPTLRSVAFFSLPHEVKQRLLCIEFLDRKQFVQKIWLAFPEQDVSGVQTFIQAVAAYAASK